MQPIKRAGKIVMANVNTEMDPQNLEDARATWPSFTKLVKYSCIGVVVVLLGLLIFVYQ